MKQALIAVALVVSLSHSARATELPTLLFAAGTARPLTAEAVRILRSVLSRNKNYAIRGYACPHDAERLQMAEARAQTVKDILLEAGFAATQLKAMAYDEDKACKVTIVDQASMKHKDFSG